MAQDQFRCGECGATFSSREGLEKHNREMHSRYTCEVCGAILTSERDLDEHNRELHPEVQRTAR